MVTGLNSLNSLLTGATADASDRSQAALEQVRDAILDSLNACGLNEETVIRLRVSYANDLQDLWYMRGDLMAAISAAKGEAEARRLLDHVSELFKGHLPRGLSSRPSPLSQ
jgi:hypothetical protein